MTLANAQVIQEGNNYYVQHGSDKDLLVTFSNIPILQDYESQVQGRPIYKDVPYIEIVTAGNTKNRVHRAVKMQGDGVMPSDIERFPRQWDAFQRQAEQVFEGTPITEYAPVSKSQALELKAQNIHTVEHLAAVSDSVVDSIGLGGRKLRENARSWLEQAKSGSEITRLQAENDTLRTDVELLKKQIETIMSAVEDKSKTKGKENGN